MSYGFADGFCGCFLGLSTPLVRRALAAFEEEAKDVDVCVGVFEAGAPRAGSSSTNCFSSAFRSCRASESDSGAGTMSKSDSHDAQEQEGRQTFEKHKLLVLLGGRGHVMVNDGMPSFCGCLTLSALD